MSKIKNILGIIIIAALVIVGVVFALLNETAVPLDLFFLVTPPVHISLLVFAAFAVGLLIGMMVTGVTVMKVKVNARRRQREAATALSKA
ncbi:MAG: LapA family protein [Hahellaceae bacterium]|nr:LapA family protein [Hahellaceae bacterium]